VADWLDYPEVRMRKGKWVVEPPPNSEESFGVAQTFSTLDEVFDLEARDASKYESFIKEKISSLVKSGRKFGALVMEPVILGAGGMHFA
jgi:dethiobiotin synthetase/adenosylmethionine--8-amino-7-oxononanoate aminotransferase